MLIFTITISMRSLQSKAYFVGSFQGEILVYKHYGIKNKSD